MHNAFRAPFQLLFKINWWAHVTETPEDNKITVFKNGTWKGLKGKIPIGGHNDPNSIVGLNLEWKKAQKKERKKKTSLTINNNIPTIKPFKTILEWKPWYVLSRTTSRHHIDLNISTVKIDKKNRSNDK